MILPHHVFFLRLVVPAVRLPRAQGQAGEVGQEGCPHQGPLRSCRTGEGLSFVIIGLLASDPHSSKNTLTLHGDAPCDVYQTEKNMYNVYHIV